MPVDITGASPMEDSVRHVPVDVLPATPPIPALAASLVTTYSRAIAWPAQPIVQAVPMVPLAPPVPKASSSPPYASYALTQLTKVPQVAQPV